MGKFLVNVGYRWPVYDVDGYVFNARGVNKERALRRQFNYPPNENQWILFDPQLYLSGLDGDVSSNTCANLATYPWFGIEIPAFDSEEMTTRDWMSSVRGSYVWRPTLPQDETQIEKVVKECLQFQIDFGVTHLIAPTPLIDNSDDQFSIQLDWLKAALRLKNEFELPMFASVAIREYLLSPCEPARNLLLQTILDNLSVMDFEGVYLLVIQEDAPYIRITDKNVLRALLYMCRILGGIASKKVLVNFADDFGFACVAAGACGFVAGTSTKERRMCLSDFADRSGGSSYPRFYSYSLIGDYLASDDLKRIRSVRLLRLIDEDVTSASESLLQALKAGRDPNEVPEWRQTLNNVAKAHLHRVLLMQRKAKTLAELGSTEKVDNILFWLQKAEAYGKLLQSKLADNPLREDGKHVEVWASAFEAHLDEFGS